MSSIPPETIRLIDLVLVEDEPSVAKMIMRSASVRANPPIVVQWFNHPEQLLAYLPNRTSDARYVLDNTMKLPTESGEYADMMIGALLQSGVPKQYIAISSSEALAVVQKYGVTYLQKPVLPREIFAWAKNA